LKHPKKIKVMRVILYILAIWIFVLACNNDPMTTQDNQEIAKNDTLSVLQMSKIRLIEQLNKIKQILNSNNSKEISSIFDFPKSDSEFSIYIDDSTFNEQLRLNSNNITKENFLNNYKVISSNIWVDDIKYLLNNLPIDSLIYKDKLEVSNLIEKEPCYNSYKIEVIGDSISLITTMKSNENFISKQKATNEIEENSSEICEHSLWWTFKFDGKRLIFKRISGAG
jgi:hypothetical protein